MKLIAAIFLLLSIVTTEVVVHIMVHNDHEISLIDSKTESEKESEKENGEDEKEKDIVDSALITNHIWSSEYIYNLGVDSYLVLDNVIEINLPPPDLT